MKLINLAVKLCLLLILLVNLPGCLYISIKQNVETDEKSKIAVKFESSTASEIFHSKIKIYNVKKYSGIHMESKQAMIPFLVFIDHKTFFKTKYYNYKVDEADLNKDGMITLDEAVKYKKNNREFKIIEYN